jgi:tetratricopeptide (TPR) repeat protein
MNAKRARAGTVGLLVALGVVAGPTGCRPDDQRTDTVDPTTAGRANLPEAARAVLDSGNVAYRGASYEAALRHYARVTELAPDDPTGWFGVYMAHHALGNLDAADSALERSRRLAPGASLIRPDANDTSDTAGGGGR